MEELYTFTRLRFHDHFRAGHLQRVKFPVVHVDLNKCDLEISHRMGKWREGGWALESGPRVNPEPARQPAV